MSASDPASDPVPAATVPAPEPPTTPLDIRLLVPAAAGWLTAILLVAYRPAVSLLTAAVTLTLAIATAVLVRRTQATTRALAPQSNDRADTTSATQRGWALLGVLVVVTGMALAAALQTHTLRTGPIRTLAAESATVEVHLKLTSDPVLRRTPGTHRPPYVVLQATIEEVHSRPQPSAKAPASNPPSAPPPTASTNGVRVRTPVLLIAGESWRDVRYGQRIAATGRLEAVQDGDDVAATLSVRTKPRPLSDPTWWLQAAEKVRAGLRAAVADEPTDVRGLVPALVMGDESALPEELTEDFKTTGLTHLSAVSGESVTPVGRVLVQPSAIGNTAGQTLFCYPSVGATFARPNTHLTAKRWCLGSGLLGESACIPWAWSGSMPALCGTGPSASVTGVSPLLDGLSGELAFETRGIRDNALVGETLQVAKVVEPLQKRRVGVDVFERLIRQFEVPPQARGPGPVDAQRRGHSDLRAGGDPRHVVAKASTTARSNAWSNAGS